MPAVPIKYQEPMDHPYQDNGSSLEHYSSGSSSSSKQTSPAPSNRSDSNRDSPALKGSKGKLFQCSGFGDCRMVFTRSEHLARHARRFDNMVQHTQTHTKGARRESSAGIASKIAVESHRKSDAGLLEPALAAAAVAASGGSRNNARPATKTLKTKRSSISSASGSETQAAARRNRIHSMPLLNLDLSPSNDNHDITAAVKEDVSSTPSSPLSSAFISSLNKTQNKDSGKGRKKAKVATASQRKGSVGSSSSSSGTSMSWYASKLHHKSSADHGLGHFGRRGSLDAHLPSLSRYSFDYTMDPSDYRRPRHPLSPERSSHSEDDEDSDDLGSSMSQRSRRHQPSWGGMVDSMDNVTLPPLRSSEGFSNHSTRLPSITSGYRTHSGSFGHRHDREPYAPKSRRLSLADLEAPIYKTKKVVDHSIQVHQAKFEGVDVSEDEIHALEAFGELWAQGRDMGMDEAAPSLSLTASSSSGLRSVIKSEFSQPTPGLDHGRRSPRATDDKDYSLLSTAMDLD
ncbi:hypothetical protein BG015_005103 [Linnemannia schmuckeri]|uniref:C2H2-type domain-containing protein n=1 Tax=Linnemannia schmuckeri TaxID=64567 RepID=A0A9P5VCQ9_9FUNG|nr:hypothetical protein BG015_005103 [Linnemannia schmuckeri]